MVTWPSFVAQVLTLTLVPTITRKQIVCHVTLMSIGRSNFAAQCERPSCVSERAWGWGPLRCILGRPPTRQQSIGNFDRHGGGYASWQRWAESASAPSHRPAAARRVQNPVHYSPPSFTLARKTSFGWPLLIRSSSGHRSGSSIEWGLVSEQRKRMTNAMPMPMSMPALT